MFERWGPEGRDRLLAGAASILRPRFHPRQQFWQRWS